MVSVSVSEASRTLPALVSVLEREPVFIGQDGRPVAVLVSAAWYDRVAALLEDAADVAAFDEATSESDPNIPLRDVEWGPAGSPAAEV